LRAGLRDLARSVADRLTFTATVPIARCYHYRGFRYGGFGHNPYEDFIVGLARGDDVAGLRKTFADAMLSCRPRGFAAALQIDIADWPLWEYPWQAASVRPIGEVERLEENPDVVTHFCPRGVLASQINREFGWLENAWRNIRREGYRPREYGFVTCLKLVGPGAASYIVLDGNHRLAALHAVGARLVEVKVPWLRIVRRRRVRQWPRVRDGALGQEEALAIFDRYFWSSNPPLVPQNPAPMLIDEPPLWPGPGGEPIATAPQDTHA